MSTRSELLLNMSGAAFSECAPLVDSTATEMAAAAISSTSDAVRVEYLRRACSLRSRIGRSWSLQRYEWIDLGLAEVAVPQHSQTYPIELAGGLYFAQRPLTNRLFAHYLRSKGLPVPQVRDHIWEQVGESVVVVDSYEDDPSVGISATMAEDICVWLTTFVPPELRSAGWAVRLPTVGEWTCWRNTVTEIDQLVNAPGQPGHYEQLAPTGAFGSTADGRWFDVQGNAMEWTSTYWPYSSLTVVEEKPYEELGWSNRPEGLEDVRRLLRGDSWRFSEDGPGCACVLPADSMFEDVGFRPVLAPGPQQAVAPADSLAKDLFIHDKTEGVER